jgi:hypothetical protein
VRYEADEVEMSDHSRVNVAGESVNGAKRGEGRAKVLLERRCREHGVVKMKRDK